MWYLTRDCPHTRRFWEIVGNTKDLFTKRFTPIEQLKPPGLPETVFDFSDVSVPWLDHECIRSNRHLMNCLLS